MSLHDSRPRFAVSKPELPPGLLFEIARTAGLTVPTDRFKVQIHCPFHHDRTPSAVLFESNSFFCSACSLKLSAKAFAEKLALPWPTGSGPPQRTAIRETAIPSKSSVEASFTDAHARSIWTLALARARTDPPFLDDQPVYEFLRKRGLLMSFDLGAFGIISRGMLLPQAIRSWLASGHRIVVPLHDEFGRVAGIQSRTIRETVEKTRFPFGSRVTGLMFANEAGKQVLRGAHTANDPVLLAEGLTDFLALTTVTQLPVLSAPGTPFFVGCIRSWACGRSVILAPDRDAAGDRVLLPAAHIAYSLGARLVYRLVWPATCNDAADALIRLGAPTIEAAIHEARCMERP